MKIGLTAYNMDAQDFVEATRAADEAGFHSIWLGEHLVLPIGYDTPHPTTGKPDAHHIKGPIIAPDTELVDPLITLGAAAAVTDRIKLVTGIYLLPLRHPLAIARSTCTLQDLAAGRLELGVGFGWLPEEFEALDVKFSERIGRFTETIEILRTAWRGGEVVHHGRYHDISGVQVTHRPTSVPLILGGNVDRALERAARLGDGWFASGTPELSEAIRLRAELTRLRAEADEALGEERPFPMTFRMAGCDPADAARYRDEGFEHVLIWADKVWPAGGSLDEKRERLFEAADALGVSRT